MLRVPVVVFSVCDFFLRSTYGQAQGRERILDLLMQVFSFYCYYYYCVIVLLLFLLNT
jgi:hypothetical protein